MNRFKGPQNKMLKGLVLVVLMGTGSLALAQAPSPAAKPNEQTWTVNFNDSDIQEVIKFIAGATGKTIIIDPKVRGPIKVINSKPLNAKELYALFLASLDIYGFTAVESGNIVRIIANRDARNMAIPTEKTVTTKDDLYITQVIPLKNTSAAKILAALRPLVPQYGHLTTYEPSNALIITDTRANVARMNELVKQLDTIGVTETDVVQLRYANASDVVSMLTQLEKPDPNRGSSTSPAVIVADKRINAVVINGDDMTRQRLKLLIEDLDRPQTQNSNVRVVYLHYAKAADVAKVLSGMLQSFAQGTKGADGTATNNAQPAVQADEATNSVLITADVNTMDTMLSVIDSLDIRRAQVLVEAIIAEVSTDGKKELGIEWMYRDDKYGFGSNSNSGVLGNIGSAALAASDKNASSDDKDAALVSLASGLAGVDGQVFGFGRLGKATDFLAVLKMLQTSSQSNILSTPNILMTDNTEGTISVGQQIPVKSGSYAATGTGNTSGSIGSPFTTYNREDVGIKLEVTPHINEGDAVVLDIKQEVSSVQRESADGFITNKREINTQILSADGETVVLGGLIEDKVESGDRRVPILGSIPVLGHLFRSQSSNKVKTNLLVFIRATVVRDDKVLTGATAEKYRLIREQQNEYRRNRGLLVSKKDVPQLPEWDSLPHKSEPQADDKSKE